MKIDEVNKNSLINLRFITNGARGGKQFDHLVNVVTKNQLWQIGKEDSGCFTIQRINAVTGMSDHYVPLRCY